MGTSSATSTPNTGGQPPAGGQQYSYGSGLPGANPYLDQSFNRAADNVEGRMRGSTAFQGLSNSGVQQQYSRNINDLGNQVYGGAYENEANRRQGAGLAISQLQQQAREGDLNRQFQASAGMPGMLTGGTQYQLGLGDVERSGQQQGINSDIQAWTERQQYPYQSLNTLAQAINVALGAGGTTVSQANPGQYDPTSTAGMMGGFGQ